MTHSTIPIEAFAQDLQQEVLTLAESDDQETLCCPTGTPQTVLRHALRSRRVRGPTSSVTTGQGGWRSADTMVDEAEGRLNLFLSIHTNSSPTPRPSTRQQR